MADALAFVASVVLAVVVSLAFRFLYNAAAFWLLDYRGISNIAITVSLFFSGMILPLQFFPFWLKALAHALPFQSIIQVPIDVYLGKHHGLSLIGALALQAAWAVALLALADAALRAGTRKLVIQGG